MGNCKKNHTSWTILKAAFNFIQLPYKIQKNIVQLLEFSSTDWLNLFPPHFHSVVVDEKWAIGGGGDHILYSMAVGDY